MIAKKSILMLILGCIYWGRILSQTPDWQWARHPGASGASGEVRSHAVAVDGLGNVYTTGWYWDTDLTFGLNTLNFSSDGDIYLVKYDSLGNAIWAIGATGSGFDETRSITVDEQGDIYVTGIYDGPTLTFGGITITNNNSGTTDMFLAKFDSAGVLLWIQSAGGPDSEFADQVAVDFNGNVYVAGSFESVTMSFGAVTLTNTGDEDIYLVKYDSNGNVLWAKSGGGSDLEWATCVTTDPFGNVLIAGPAYSDSIYFDGTLIVNDAFSGYEGTLIIKFDSLGNVLWGKQIVGNDFFNELYSLASDAFGNIFVAGSTISDTVTFDSLVITNPLAGYFDMILAKYNSAGTILWAKKTGGSATDYGYSVAADPSGNAYLVGYFNSDTIYFDASNYVAADPNYFSALFMVKYDNGGNVMWTKSTGGIDQPATYGYAQQGIVCDNNGIIYTVGCFNMDSIPFNTDTLILGSGYRNSFIAKLDDSGPCSANFELIPDSVTQHLYWAINQASGIMPLSYLWDWNDGNTDTVAYPSHIYAQTGFYSICLTITDSSGCTSTDCHTTMLQRNNGSFTASNPAVVVNVVPFIPTGLDENYQLNNIQLFPNPVSNLLTVISPGNRHKYRVGISDITGNIIYSTTNIDREKFEINTTSFDNGMYLLRIETDSSVETRKFIVSK